MNRKLALALVLGLFINSTYSQVTSDFGFITVRKESTFHQLVKGIGQYSGRSLLNTKLFAPIVTNTAFSWNLFTSNITDLDSIKIQDEITVGKYTFWGNPKNPYAEIEFAKGWIGPLRLSSNIIVPINQDIKSADDATSKLISNGGSLNLNMALPWYIYKRSIWNGCPFNISFASSYKVGANVPALGSFSDSIKLFQSITIAELQLNLMTQEKAGASVLSQMGVSLIARISYTSIDKGMDTVLGIENNKKWSTGVTTTLAIHAGERIKVLVIKPFVGTNYKNFSKKPMIGLTFAF